MNAGVSGFSILIADDNPDNLRVLEGTLKEKGYTVRVATNGEMALRSAKTLPPHLILLDIHMPRMDGYEACQKMKEDPDLKDIPIIFLSALTETFNKIKAFELGGVAYLTKPFEPMEVLAYVEAHIKIAQYSKELQIMNEKLKKSKKGLEGLVEENTKEIIEGMEKYSTLVEESNDGIIVIQDGVVKFANKRMLDMAGVSEDELLGRSFLDLVSDKDKSRVMENYTKRMAGEEAPSNYEIMLSPLKEGDDIPVDVNATKMPFEGKQAAMAIVRDITKRKKAEEKIRRYQEHLEDMVDEKTAMLRESETRLKKAEEIANLGNWEWTIATGDILWSDETFSIFGLQPQECSPTFEGFMTYVHPDDRDIVQSAVDKALEKDTPYEIEHRIIREDEETRHIRERGEITKDEEGNPVKMLGTVLDITDRKIVQLALEESEKKLRTQANQLIQTEKMAGLGIMAAGIAHELNNPLMGILNYTQFCIRNTQEDSKVYPVLKDIESVSRRSADIVQNMLSFSRKDPEAIKPCEVVDLQEMIAQIERLIDYRIVKENVDLVVDIPEDAPDIAMDTGKLQQVILNLITNALDAFEEKGEKKITVSLRPYGDKARITVEDTGIGIPQDKINNIFDPFFTSKPPGKGTGMGLSISHTIVSSYSGEITCESEVGKGSKFYITLPKGGNCDE